MIIKILWALTTLNTLALLIFIGFYFANASGRNVSYEEKGWTVILSIVALIVIALAALALHFGHSTGMLIFGGFFAALPLAIAVSIVISNKLKTLNTQKTYAQRYYKRGKQRRIAAAIENNDTSLLRQLIKGVDINEPGIRASGEEPLNYLQFAVRLRSNPSNFPFNDVANEAAIRILVKHGAAVQPAFAEATSYLKPDLIALLLDNGANPNCPGFENLNPLLFETLDGNSTQNDIAILLVQYGADVNAIKDARWTPAMYAAERADISKQKNDNWRVVRYLLQKAKADINFASKDGKSLRSIIDSIEQKAALQSIKMPENFYAVVKFLK